MSLTWSSKNPSAIVDYGVDWTSGLGDGDTITGSTFDLIDAQGITFGTGEKAPSFTDKATKAWLYGGTAGQIAQLRNTVTTAGGRTLPEDILVVIMADRAVAFPGCYASVAQADTYALNRGWTDWMALNDGAKVGKLLEATAYLDATYRWPGTLYDYNQAQGWPRSGAYDREGRALTGVPVAVVSATVEAARLALASPLAGGAAASAPQLIRKKTGPLEKEWAKVDGGSLQASRMAFVTRLLSGITGNSASTLTIRRA